MSDKELLELAAKAAGIELTYLPHHPGEWAVFRNSSGGETDWNPLTDDGDALRLAVKLNLDVIQDNEKGDSVEVIANDHPIPTAPNEDYIGNIWASEYRGDDPYAATRRAIVRAAAEIGRGME